MRYCVERYCSVESNACFNYSDLINAWKMEGLSHPHSISIYLTPLPLIPLYTQTTQQLQTRPPHLYLTPIQPSPTPPPT